MTSSTERSRLYRKRKREEEELGELKEFLLNTQFPLGTTEEEKLAIFQKKKAAEAILKEEEKQLKILQQKKAKSERNRQYILNIKMNADAIEMEQRKKAKAERDRRYRLNRKLNADPLDLERQRKAKAERAKKYRLNKKMNADPVDLERQRKAKAERAKKYRLKRKMETDMKKEIKPLLEPLVIIKEELGVDDDYSANTSEVSILGDDMDFEDTFNDMEQNDSLEECNFISRDGSFEEVISKEVITVGNSPAKEDNVPTSEKTDSASAVNDGLSTILRIADSLALDINNILTDDLGLNDLNATQPRSETLKSSEKCATLGEPKSKYTELEHKLRIHYLKIMLKKEEELVDIKIEANKLHLQNAKIKAEQMRQVYLQKMENLKLENKLMTLRLEKEAK